MRLIIFTIVKDGGEHIKRHLPEFEKMTCDWEWRIAEGSAANTRCTKWCQPQQPGLSRDGTTTYLNKISNHPCVKVFRKQLWDGKVEQVNACIHLIPDQCVALQCDVDEYWSATQLEKILRIFEQKQELMRAYFFCRYFVGKNLITIGENCYGANRGEWLRAFRYYPGWTFSAHEPPIFGSNRGPFLTREQTRKLDLVFDHHSWDDEANVLAKLKFYGYGEENIEGWRRLQAHRHFPVKLRHFFPWVDKQVEVDIYKP